MKIYTRAGDDGSTGLVSGERVSKHDARVELYGTSDELNSVLGCALAELPTGAPDGRTSAPTPGAVLAQAGGPLAALREDLIRQQNLLFELGSELAGFIVAPGVSSILPEDVAFLEGRIDSYMDVLPAMHSFVLPGGSRAASLLHLARTVCRRLERLISEVNGRVSGPAVHPTILTYVNRLSDFLFVGARLANHAVGLADTPWSSRAREEVRRRKEITPET